jgi:hypothetical protein
MTEVELEINEAMFDAYEKWRLKRQYFKGEFEGIYLDAWEAGRRFENGRLSVKPTESQPTPNEKGVSDA